MGRGTGVVDEVADGARVGEAWVGGFSRSGCEFVVVYIDDVVVRGVFVVG